ncbi:hypothetical protein D9M68_992610 [compost metagenome]
MIEHEGKPVAARPGIDGHKNDAGERGGDHGLNELGVVGHQQREAIAGREALLAQSLCDALAVLPQLQVAARLDLARVLEDEQLRLRACSGGMGDALPQHQGFGVVGHGVSY